MHACMLPPSDTATNTSKKKKKKKKEQTVGRTDLEGVDAIGVALQLVEAHAGLGVPHAHRAVIATAHHQPPIVLETKKKTKNREHVF